MANASSYGVKHRPLPALSDKLIARLWNKVRKSEGCWEWTGSHTNGGYGLFTIHSKQRHPVRRRPGQEPSRFDYYKQTRLTASRVSFFLAYGIDPGSSQILHSCDNRRCVRPDHLRAGTPKDNAEDRDKRGRFVGRRKLTLTQVLAIIAAVDNNDPGKWPIMKSLAVTHGVSLTTIIAVAEGKRWKREIAAAAAVKSSDYEPLSTDDSVPLSY